MTLPEMDTKLKRYGPEVYDTVAERMLDSVVDAEFGSGSRAALEAIANLPDEVESNYETDCEGKSNV